MNERTKTTFTDRLGNPIYVGDIIKHYCYVDEPDRVWDYDVGIVLPKAPLPHNEKEYWWRTTLTTFFGHDKFILSNHCDYLIIGNTDEPRTEVAIRLWFSLSNRQKENYYWNTGIVGFLENFRITEDDKPLTYDEIEYALKKIEEKSTID